MTDENADRMLKRYLGLSHALREDQRAVIHKHAQIDALWAKITAAGLESRLDEFANNARSKALGHDTREDFANAILTPRRRR